MNPLGNNNPSLTSSTLSVSSTAASSGPFESTPLIPPFIAKALGDKLYEKRKAAALEIERIVREAQAAGGEASSTRIKAIIDVLVHDYTYSSLVHSRNGGLIALAAVAIALGQEHLPKYLELLIPPILSCFSDQDAKVRYYACESMYNVVKVARSESLKFFNELFDGLSKLAADPETSVKNGEELLDRLIKDIVCDQATYYPPETVIEATTSTREVPSGSPAKTAMDILKSLRISAPTSPRLQHLGEMTLTLSEQTSQPVQTQGPLPHSASHVLVPGTVPLLPRMHSCTFNVPRFIPLLTERIRTLNPSCRMFIVQWITVLASVPDLELLSFLPEFLDGLFLYLSDRHTEIRVAALNALSEFLKDIKQVTEVQRRKKHESLVDLDASLENVFDSNLDVEASKKESGSRAASELNLSVSQPLPTETEFNRSTDALDSQSKVESLDKLSSLQDSSAPYQIGQGIVLDFGRMIDILVPHLSSQGMETLIVVILDEETQATAMRWINEFIHLAREIILPYCATLVHAILPSNEANKNLYHLLLQTHASLLLSQGMTSEGHDIRVFDLQTVLDTLAIQCQDAHEETRIASIDWLFMLHCKAPQSIKIDDAIFQSLLRALSDVSEEVVKRDLQLISHISHSCSDDAFTLFLSQLLSIFSQDRRLLDSRGSLIIRQLCLTLNAERMYCRFAYILEKNIQDLDFCTVMVQHLNVILMAAPELMDLRRKLKNLDAKEGQTLFITLYRSWCHNAVSVLTLCLLAQAYEHASQLLHLFGTEMEITVSFLVQVDKLVQLLESPVFTYLRLQLLEPDRYPHLLKCMYGILMLLPQSSAFATLRNRLNSVSSIVGLFAHSPTLQPSTPSQKHRKNSGSSQQPPTTLETLPWNDLLNHFKDFQRVHEKYRATGVVLSGPFLDASPEPSHENPPRLSGSDLDLKKDSESKKSKSSLVDKRKASPLPGSSSSEKGMRKLFGKKG